MSKEFIGYKNIDGKFIISEGEEAEIVKFIFEKYTEYSKNPPTVLVEEMIEDYAARGEKLTYADAEANVSSYRIQSYILGEIKERWPDSELTTKAQYERKRGSNYLEYCKSVLYSGRYQPAENHTSIIDKEDYEKVQEVLKRN